MVKGCLFCGCWLWSWDLYCKNCQIKIIGPSTFYINDLKVFGAAVYNNTTCKPILKLKYNNNPFIGKPMAQFIHNQLNLLGFVWDCDFLVVIPITWTKNITRGYNQSQIIGQQLSKITGIPLGDFLKKTDYSSQINKNYQERIEGPALQLKTPIVNKKLLIIDDVVTTGSTLWAAYNVLDPEKNKIQGLVFNFNQKFISKLDIYNP